MNKKTPEFDFASLNGATTQKTKDHIKKIFDILCTFLPADPSSP